MLKAIRKRLILVYIPSHPKRNENKYLHRDMHITAHSFVYSSSKLETAQLTVSNNSSLSCKKRNLFYALQINLH